MIRGHNVYNSIWDGCLMEVLPCKIDIKNQHNPFAVSLIKSGIGTVDHIPTKIRSIVLYSFDKEDQ